MRSRCKKNLLLATYWMLRFSLKGNHHTLSLFNDHELIKLIPSVLAKYSEFQQEKKYDCMREIY